MATQLHNEIIATPPPVSHAAEFKKHLPSIKAPGAVPKKKLIRRTDRDYSQALRRGYQFAFFLMNVWLGGQFYLWCGTTRRQVRRLTCRGPQESRAGCPSQA